jgi:hypothetical protein
MLNDIGSNMAAIAKMGHDELERKRKIYEKLNLEEG